MNYIILDLDNCIADDLWRRPLIDWNQADLMLRYYQYHLNGRWDTLRNSHLFSRSDHIMISTSRPECFRDITREWLWDKGVPYQSLYMRGNNDYRPTLELKEDNLHRAMADVGIRDYAKIMAYDDLEPIIRMYRRFGVQAEQRWIHTVPDWRN